jgi:hypothetical protein
MTYCPPRASQAWRLVQMQQELSTLSPEVAQPHQPRTRLAKAITLYTRFSGSWWKRDEVRALVND